MSVKTTLPVGLVQQAARKRRANIDSGLSRPDTPVGSNRNETLTMEYSERQPTDPSGSRWSDLLHNRSGAAGWMLLVNLFLGIFFFLELQWYLENIYRFAPWIPFVSYDRIHTVIDIIWGAFMVHVGAPLARGRLAIFSAPEQVLGKEAVGVFCHAGTAAVAAALVTGVYVLITLSPALHLSHSSAQGAPVVEIDGSRRHFEGNSITLLGGEEVVCQTEIVVTGKHEFYRVSIHPSDMETYWLLPTHKWVRLDRLFLRRDLVATLQDAQKQTLGSFCFRYQRDMDIASQCAGSGLQQKLSKDDPRACAALLQSIMADMAGNPDARLLRDSDGRVAYGGRFYHYSYSFGPELKLAIRAPEAKSEFANNPREALERFRSAGVDNRGQLVVEFVRDVGNLSSSALERIFQALYESSNLLEYLDGTTAQRMDALNFTRDVLALGVDHVAPTAVDDLLTLVQRHLVETSASKVFVPAIDALIALTRDSAVLRTKVLECVGKFISMLGTHHNAAKPDIAGILLQTLDENTSTDDSKRVLSILSAIRRHAVGAGTVFNQVDSQIRDRIDALPDSSVADRLRQIFSARDKMLKHAGEGRND